MACNGLHPRVAVMAIISDEEGRIVAGRRLSPLGTVGLEVATVQKRSLATLTQRKGQWGFPGGHLEYGEDFFACVERETLEETGLVVRGVKIVGITNDKFTDASKHYITLFAKCERVDPQQQPQRLEPNKCQGWSWKSWQEIEMMAMVDKDSGPPDQQLFLPMANLVREVANIDVIVGSD